MTHDPKHSCRYWVFGFLCFGKDFYVFLVLHYVKQPSSEIHSIRSLLRIRVLNVGKELIQFIMLYSFKRNRTSILATNFIEVFPQFVNKF